MRSWRLRSDPRQETGPFPRRLRDSDGPAKSPGLGSCCVPVRSRCKGPTSQLELPAICRVAQVAVLMSAPNRAADAGNRPPNASKGFRRAFVLLSSSGDSPCGLCCRRQTGPKSPNLALSRPDLAGEIFGIFLPVIPIWPGFGIRNRENIRIFFLPQSRFGPRDFGTFPIPIISDLVGIGPIIGGLGISKSRFCQHRL